MADSYFLAKQDRMTSAQAPHRQWLAAKIFELFVLYINGSGLWLIDMFPFHLINDTDFFFFENQPGKQSYIV